MARSTGSHALPVGWALLVFPRLSRVSIALARVFLAWASIYLYPAIRYYKPSKKWRACFYSAPTAFFVGFSNKYAGSTIT